MGDDGRRVTGDGWQRSVCSECGQRKRSFLGRRRPDEGRRQDGTGARRVAGLEAEDGVWRKEEKD